MQFLRVQAIAHSPTSRQTKPQCHLAACHVWYIGGLESNLYLRSGEATLTSMIVTAGDMIRSRLGSQCVCLSAGDSCHPHCINNCGLLDAPCQVDGYGLSWNTILFWLLVVAESSTLAENMSGHLMWFKLDTLPYSGLPTLVSIVYGSKLRWLPTVH